MSAPQPPLISWWNEMEHRKLLVETLMLRTAARPVDPKEPSQLIYKEAQLQAYAALLSFEFVPKKKPEPEVDPNRPESPRAGEYIRPTSLSK